MLRVLAAISFLLFSVSAQGDQVPLERNHDRQIASLLDQMHALRVENSKVLKEVKAENVKLRASVDSVKAENTKMVSSMNAMKAENTNLVASMDALKAENSNLASQVDAMKADNAKILEKMNTMESKFGVTVSENTDMKPESMTGVHNMDTFISFTAFATVDHTYNDGDKVLFDGIIRNYGGYYNASESQFVCPVTAYYLFSVSVKSMSNYHLHGSIYLDNELLVTGSAVFESYDQGSNTVVTLCEQGQVVAVYVSCCNENGMEGNNQKRSTFTGVLLRIV